MQNILVYILCLGALSYLVYRFYQHFFAKNTACKSCGMSAETSQPKTK